MWTVILWVSGLLSIIGNKSELHQTDWLSMSWSSKNDCSTSLFQINNCVTLLIQFIDCLSFRFQFTDGNVFYLFTCQLLMQTKEVSNNRRTHKASSKECGGGGNWAQITAKSFSIFCAGLPQAEESKPMQKGETNATKPHCHKNKVMNDSDNHDFES